MSTDTTFPFAPPQAPEGEDGEGQDKNSRSALLVLVAAAVAVVLAIGSWFLFLSGGDEAEITAQPAVPPAATAPQVPAPQVPAPQVPAPKAAAQPAAPAAAPAARNPFKTLLPAAQAPATAPVGGAGTTTAPVGAPTGGTSTPTGSTSTPVTTTPSVPKPVTTTPPKVVVTVKPSGPAAKAPVSIRLVNVQRDNSSARVVVGGKTYNPRVGQSFATYFNVLRLQDGKCGVFKYSNLRFELCEGGSATMK